MNEQLHAPDLRAMILGADDRAPVAFPVEEWGCTIWIQPLATSQRTDFERRAAKKQTDQLREMLLLAAAVDFRGDPIFTTDDLLELGKKSGDVLQRIADEIMRISGIKTGPELKAEAGN